MKANETKALLEQWGIISSHSRPRVSAKPMALLESFFRSLKYTVVATLARDLNQLRLDSSGSKVTCRVITNRAITAASTVTPKSRFDGTEEAILKARRCLNERVSVTLIAGSVAAYGTARPPEASG